MDSDLVLYVYKCAECGHDGSVHLAGDTHDGEETKCKFCGTEVSVQWDGGVTFDVAPQLLELDAKDDRSLRHWPAGTCTAEVR
jgi:DNA-directed RNA polymerase subunit RPC12/RpoP